MPPSCATGLQPETRPRPLQEIVDAALERGRSASAQGTVTGQIPLLSAVPATRLAIAVATVDGEIVQAGDSNTSFSLQSITKLFALCALLRHDARAWDHVGWDPTSAGFGSVGELERQQGRPTNPFVNSGALVVTDRLLQYTGDAVQAVVDLITQESGGKPSVDHQVAESESGSDHRNSAIAHVLAEHGRLQNPIADVLRQYFAQCAITASAVDVARAGLFLARRSRSHSALEPETIRRVNAVLLTAGMYGAAGDIAYRVGLPAKSGIGGGILAIMPGRGTICVWSPPLDATGTSTGGVAALEEYSRLAGWSVF